MVRHPVAVIRLARALHRRDAWLFFHSSAVPSFSPSSSVVALISVLDGPVPALLKAWTTTPYWANFLRLSRVYTSLSPVAFISTMLYWPLLPGPFSL